MIYREPGTLNTVAVRRIALFSGPPKADFACGDFRSPTNARERFTRKDVLRKPQSAEQIENSDRILPLKKVIP